MQRAHVLAAMNAVSADLAAIGVAKTQKNKEQGFMFRGVDAVMNALAPLLVKHKLLILPRYFDHACETRRTASGKNIYSVTLRGEFHFCSVLDGTEVVIATYGEGMDLADKATTKAMAIAYKYAIFEGFCVPLEPTEDPDAQSHEETTRPGQSTRLDVQEFVDNFETMFLEAKDLPELSSLFTLAQSDVKKQAKKEDWPIDWTADALGTITKAKDKVKTKLQSKMNDRKKPADTPPPDEPQPGDEG